jgi:septum formation protein
VGALGPAGSAGAGVGGVACLGTAAVLTAARGYGDRVSTHEFVLASASPARLKTLRAAGLEPTVLVSGVDESIVEWTDARSICANLARLKAQAVAGRVRDMPRDGRRRLVLGCDSVLEFEDGVHGKPADDEQAVACWRRMRGRTGILHTGHFLTDADSGDYAEAVGGTLVTFAEVTDAEIDAYVGTGEPGQVAGAFTIDGLGGWFVDRIEGDASNVVGVSLPVLRGLLGDLGVDIPELWRTA